MSESICPACECSLELTRAPVARVIGARIMSFCSKDCASDFISGNTRASSHIADPLPEQSDPAPAPALDVATDEASDSSDDEYLSSPDEPSEDTFDHTRGEVSSTLRFEASSPSRGGRRRKVIALSAAILLGGMATAIIEAVSPSTPSNASASGLGETRMPALQPEPSLRSETAVPSLAPPVLDAPGLAARARQELASQLGSSSERIRRIAAVALSRTGDARAISTLGELLISETSELRRIEVAFALARSGDARGTERLVAALGSDRRDVRLDAAQALVELGDARGLKYLKRMLSLRNHRVGAAAALASVEDPEGLATLRRELESAKSSNETKMRAAVALGRGGQEDVQPQLREILEQGRYRVGAAVALAHLGDSSVVSHLQEQLKLSALRVEAAVALRELKAEVDFQPLADALATGDAVMRVSASEAILILTDVTGVAGHN